MSRTHARILFAVQGLVAALFLACLSSTAMAEAPTQTALLMAGKHSLYQRIMTKPHAALLDADSDQAVPLARDLAPFSVYYAYARRNGFVQVGVNITGTPKGWIRDTETVDWKQSIVVAFNNRAARQRKRQLFFADRDTLAHELESETFVQSLSALREAAESGHPDGRIVAVEPENFVDIDHSFYLFPILSFEPAFLPFNQEGNFLEVASVTSARSSGNAEDFRAGLAFVLDTTRSMQPYIDQTKEAIRRVQATLSQSDIGQSLRFGLVGFRQDPAVTPALEYHVKTFLPVAEDSTADRFVSTIGSVSAATTSTPSFDEDSIGGVFEAIQSSDWSRFQARVIVLVTDAAPRAPSNGHTYAGDIDVQQLAGLAERKGIQLFVLHLRTPDGAPDHDAAEAAYEQLSRREGQSNYVGVAGGDLRSFSNELDGLANTLATVIRSAHSGEPVLPAGTSRTAQLMARAGQAMQLEYLGARAGEAAPDFFRAWTTDKAPEDPRVAALDVRIMLTRNQLSSLAGALRPIVEEGEAPGSQTDPMAFFTRVQEIAARANNDLRQISNNTELGPVLGEYLDELPYRSFILGLTAQDWVTLNRPQQRDIILRLKSKLQYFEQVHNSPERWVRLDPDASDGEEVTLIPLDQMP